jgi:hypothetical protein
LIKMKGVRPLPPGAAFAHITEADMHNQSPTHALGQPRQGPRPPKAWLALQHRGLEAVSNASPWLMALGLCGAYVTIDKPQWVGLNLAFCVGMVVVALLRLWHVLSEPLPGNH